jgi:hypothetical protein
MDAGGMSWVNFNFKFLTGAIANCAEELDNDMYSTMVTAVGTLIGTFIMRYVLDTYILPWWIRRKVHAIMRASMYVHVCIHV